MADEETKQNMDESEPEEEVVEFEFNEDGEEDLKKTLKKLRADLKQAKKEKEEYLTGWQKERADFANYKKQEDERRSSYSEFLREDILSKFLAVLDNFNMAFANKEAWEKVDANWRKGVEYIYSQLAAVFEEYGVKEIGKEGEKFDHNLHNSIDVVCTPDQSLDHQIAQVVQKGYKMGDRVLRPAQVKVYEYQDGE